MDKHLKNFRNNQTRIESMAAANRRLAKVAVQYSADNFVVYQSLVLRIHICGENRHLHQGAEPLPAILNDRHSRHKTTIF
jgi:hypothetical protein